MSEELFAITRKFAKELLKELKLPKLDNLKNIQILYKELDIFIGE